MAGLAALLQYDRQSLIDAAYRQSLAVATGVDRLLHYGVRNLERALAGTVEDAAAWQSEPPALRQRRLQAAIEGVASRQEELLSIALVDAQGAALTPGRGDPSFAAWRGPQASLAVGPLQRDEGGQWALPLARRFDGERWLLAWLHPRAIDAMIRDLDIGRDGIVTVLGRDGVVLARLPEGRDGSIVGRGTALPPEPGTSRGTGQGRRVSEIDGIERFTSFSATSGYDLVVVAGLSVREVLMPWYRNLLLAIVAMLLYWLGLVYFLHRVSAAERQREALLDELEEQAAWLDHAQEASRTGVWRLEPDGQHVKASAHTTAMFGLSDEGGLVRIERFFQRIHVDDRHRVEEAFAKTRDSGAPFYSEHRVLPRPGVERWVRATGGLVVDSHGQGRFTGTVADITDLHEAQQRLERAEAQFRALFKRNPLPFWVVDTDTLGFLAVNEAAVATYGYSEQEFRRMTMRDLLPWPAPAEADPSRPGMSPDVDGVWTHARRDGSRLDVRVFSSSIEFGARRARLVLAEDISDRVAYERDLAWRAAHDSLTGLMRLQCLVERLDRLEPAGTRYAVAFVRLRELELVAPTLGTHVGELLLREMAARLSLVGHEYGMVGFWPGECFVLVALDAARHAGMLAAIEQAIARPVDTGAGALPVSASIGLADGPGTGEGAEQVIAHAALASLQAWQEQVPVLSYDPLMTTRASERMALARRLRQALEQGEFELHYQPIRRLEDGRLTAIEALLRWRRDGELVAPDVFMPLAEASGLIVQIGRWVLDQAARCHRRLRGQGLGDVAIAVNVSAVQLLADNLPDAVRAVQRAYELPRGALHVELTESVVLRQPQAARARMLELREAGVAISIDDFGTGFSSMSYLRELPVDCLKIDRSFVQDVHVDPRNASICRALIALAQGLGLGTVAEGVEREEDLQWLRAQGCGQAQGFLLGRPQPLDALLAGMEAGDG